ncbi:Stk1 family PASTA domain-containing Ser/Thr kinase [Thermanaeromonas sp. C210]|uniref:Stk1 family PASTA domain-containing Ser/Thr kinase n=1 Tax=Thermanaeromonas sp. C210 TaxID=2731925 RepID=UPI00155C492A|nr:Stk1 family PASTA domain-containing Ser/Thr kinase [Thermanaeromonas sp. C210]GFN24009.1 serine/threonine protein kinase [Thermanaeromonas sp. C210]
MIGKILDGRYEIKEALGGGGMALVYRGQDQLLNRSVTIKILREQFASDRNFVARFQQEAQAVARLSHPNVVSIYDVGQEEGLHYLVMEYVEGNSLKEVIDRRAPLPAQEAVDIALHICEALEHAHENGIIHRDIKPHNILITKQGRVKVTDFGIAQAVSEATMPYTGTLIGSVHYLAPEQARGETTGVTADIYSLGVVLYEMLTGQVPFNGDTPLSVALKHLQEEPRPPRELNPDLPLALERIILRALAKDPARRYPSAAALRADLRALRNVLLEENSATQELPGLAALAADPPEEKKGRRRPRIWAWALMVVFFLALAAGGLWAGFRYYLVVGETVVPPVEGLTEAEALNRLAAAGLKGQVAERQNHGEVPRGCVISQNPAAGERIKRSRPVMLVVSLGPRMREVPNVVGDSERDARTKLQNARFNVVISPNEVYHPTIAAGSVVSQEPAAGSLQPEGSDVRITLSKGPEPKWIPAPNLIGKTLMDAQQTLRENKLEQGTVTYQRSEEYFSGVIIDQDPRPDARILQGSAVNLVISQGPGPARQEAVVLIEPTDDKEHHIRIVVIDAKGPHEEFNGVQKAGEKLIAVVPYYGKGTLQVFRDKEMIFEGPVPTKNITLDRDD